MDSFSLPSVRDAIIMNFSGEGKPPGLPINSPCIWQLKSAQFGLEQAKKNNENCASFWLSYCGSVLSS